jgi:predicted dehydrogenase
VGAGHFGRFHARHYADHPDVDLVAVVDCDFAKAEALAGAYGAAAFATCGRLSEVADVATVAVPTSAHFDVAGALIEAGVHVLVEKPVTETVAQAEALCRAARARGVRLDVGHVERFSSTYRALRQEVRAPRLIECRRMNPPTGRAVDVDVVLDLMIHDIDLAADLAGAPVIRVDAVGAAVRNGASDVCQARLAFANGVVADLAASRIAAVTDRTIRVYGEAGAWTADLAAGALHHIPAGLSADAVARVVPREDSLAAEIAAFVASVRGLEAETVDGETGRAVLAVAEEVRAAARRHQRTFHRAATA